jgi:glutamate dehydrogenase
VLLALKQKTGTPLYTLSVQTSERLLALQEKLYEKLEMILKRRDLVAAVMQAYIPAVLLERLGMPKVLRIFDAPEMHAYRDAMLTKKIAAMALYRHAADWDDFTSRLQRDFLGTLAETVLHGG